eukprot:TRINITY_DN154649_c0_g1_i1.p1 TRINITY_DN154649_c0_g1~~TRINITY_DN154649_c0_g1_i1.p1  ORF type:complete len:123 (+),score=7.98 TRINITY_DN154649_c0_g1_i1:113-481(+)
MYCLRYTNLTKDHTYCFTSAESPLAVRLVDCCLLLRKPQKKHRFFSDSDNTDTDERADKRRQQKIRKRIFEKNQETSRTDNDSEKMLPELLVDLLITMPVFSQNDEPKVTRDAVPCSGSHFT